MNPNGVITLLTDFGLSDPYVGIMKGVILGVNSHARLVDITHQIPHGSVLEAAFILKEACPYFPEGTVHLAVVDPGVGTSRRSIAIQTERHFFVGPDNGLFWPILKDCTWARVVHLREKRLFLSHISDTFQGRDIFAPVAAHISAGLVLHKLGPPINDPISLAYPLPEIRDNLIRGQVIRIDHFGNLITNIDKKTLENFLGKDKAIIRVGDTRINGIVKTYANTVPGGVIALIGSAGFLEIAVRLGRADNRHGPGLRKHPGMEVTVNRMAIGA